MARTAAAAMGYAPGAQTSCLPAPMSPVFMMWYRFTMSLVLGRC